MSVQNTILLCKKPILLWVERKAHKCTLTWSRTFTTNGKINPPFSSQSSPPHAYNERDQTVSVSKLDASCCQTMHVKVKFMQPAPISVFRGSSKLDASCCQTMHVKVRKFTQPAPVSVFCGSSCVLLSNNACQSTQVYATSTSRSVSWIQIQMGLCPLSRHSHIAHLHAPLSENSNMRDLSLRWSAIDTR